MYGLTEFFSREVRNSGHFGKSNARNKGENRDYQNEQFFTMTTLSPLQPIKSDRITNATSRRIISRLIWFVELYLSQGHLRVVQHHEILR